MREIIEEGIDYFAHRFAELEGEEWLKQGKPDFMDTTDLHKQAMEEAIDQTIKEISEEIEKVENPYDTTAGGFEEARWEAFSLAQGKILALLK